MARNRKWKHRAPQTPIAAANRDTPKAFRCTGAARIEAAQGEDRLPTFTGNAYTGAAMRPEMWFNPLIIDLDGVRVSQQNRPVLRQHDHEQIVGHTTSVKVTAAGIQVEGVLSGEKEHTDKVTVPAKNGFPWQLSVGANPIRSEYLEAGKTATVNGREVTGPMTISRETELGEISFVPLGADDDTSATVAASAGANHMNPFALTLKALMAEIRAAGKAATYSDEQIDKMDADEARAALKKCMADAADGDEEEEEDEDEEEETSPKASKKAKAAKKNAVQGSGNGKTRADYLTAQADFEREMAKISIDERRRHAEIIRLCGEYKIGNVEVTGSDGKKISADLAEHAILNGWTVERVKAEMLGIVQARRPADNVGVPGGLGYSTSGPVITPEVLECGLLHACRHQYRLESDDFYMQRRDDGVMVRRVDESVQKETLRDIRARYPDQVQQAAHTLFKGRNIGPQEVFRIGFRASGYGHRNLSFGTEQGIRSVMAIWDHLEKQLLIEGEGASNFSISNVLANVQNKFALQGYLYTEQAWRKFCAVRPVNDFKATKSINLLGNAMYQQLGATGELKNAIFSDQAFSNQAAMYGIIATIPYQHLVSDDLDMLAGSPLLIGRGAGLALNDNIWTLMKGMIAGTVNGDDGQPFFRTTSSSTAGSAYKPNKISGADSALSSASLQKLKAQFDSQVDPYGFPLGMDDLMPILLHGQTNWVPATELTRYRELVYAGNTGGPLKQPQGQVWAGTMETVMSRYMENANYVNSTTAFLILFAPVALAAIEVCFLGGVDSPSVLSAGPDYQFDRLGISIRGTMPFGSNQQNFRAACLSVGA